MTQEDYVFGQLLIPFIAGFFCISGVMTNRPHGMALVVALGFVLIASVMTGFGGPSLWVVVPFGGMLGFFHEETERMRGSLP